ncbi:MAG: hypothetical protein ABIG71_02210 [Candidatus Uhrbacteria bacterium]
MATKKKAVAPVRRTGSVRPKVFYAIGANTAGLRSVLSEFLRNALYHGLATDVWVNVDEGNQLTILDNGVGLGGKPSSDKDTGEPKPSPRECFGTILGESIAEGAGNGARTSALTLCQVIEAITIPHDDGGKAYRCVLHLPSFVQGVCDMTWEDPWEEVRREDTPFPANLDHGTLMILRDFRASDKKAPFDESRMRSTAKRVTAERVRNYVMQVLPPDHIRQVHVQNVRMRAPRPEGFQLWSCSPPKTVPGLGRVSGDVRISESVSGRLCTIGGTTMSITLHAFIEDAEQHNPDLARRIPAFFWDKRLSGFLRIEALEDYPSQSREHLDPAFWDRDVAVAVVDYLATVVGPAIEAKRQEYQQRPLSEVTAQTIASVIATGHQSQGVTPDVAVVQDDGDEAVDAKTVPPEQLPIILSRVAVCLEQAVGDPPYDRGVFRVENALPGETFTWNDHAKQLIVERSTSGDRVTIEAIARYGTYPVDMQSDQHPNRKRTVDVDIAPAKPTKGETFLLRPMLTEMYVDEEKRIGVRSEGGTSGTYTWTITRSVGNLTEPVGTFEVLGGTRAITFHPTVRGDYHIVATDSIDPTKQAVSDIEVRDRPRVEAPQAAPPEKDDTDTDIRRVFVGREGIYEHRGVRYRVQNAPYLSSPWDIDEGSLVFVSDSHPANRNARTPEERTLHVVWCIATGISEHCARSGDFDPGDTEDKVRVVDDVMRCLLGYTDPAA